MGEAKSKREWAFEPINLNFFSVVLTFFYVNTNRIIFSLTGMLLISLILFWVLGATPPIIVAIRSFLGSLFIVTYFAVINKDIEYLSCAKIDRGRRNFPMHSRTDYLPSNRFTSFVIFPGRRISLAIFLTVPFIAIGVLIVNAVSAPEWLKFVTSSGNRLVDLAMSVFVITYWFYWAIFLIVSKYSLRMDKRHIYLIDAVYFIMVASALFASPLILGDLVAANFGIFASHLIGLISGCLGIALRFVKITIDVSMVKKTKTSDQIKSSA